MTDEQVQEEFDKRVATQKESYDANPPGYVTAREQPARLTTMRRKATAA